MTSVREVRIEVTKNDIQQLKPKSIVKASILIPTGVEHGNISGSSYKINITKFTSDEKDDDDDGNDIVFNEIMIPLTETISKDNKYNLIFRLPFWYSFNYDISHCIFGQ